MMMRDYEVSQVFIRGSLKKKKRKKERDREIKLHNFCYRDGGREKGEE